MVGAGGMAGLSWAAVATGQEVGQAPGASAAAACSPATALAVDRCAVRSQQLCAWNRFCSPLAGSSLRRSGCSHHLHTARHRPRPPAQAGCTCSAPAGSRPPLATARTPGCRSAQARSTSPRLQGRMGGGSPAHCLPPLVSCKAGPGRAVAAPLHVLGAAQMIGARAGRRALHALRGGMTARRRLARVRRARHQRHARGLFSSTPLLPPCTASPGARPT